MARKGSIEMVGTEALTRPQLEAICRCLESVLERDGWQEPGQGTLTLRQTASARQALEKVNRALWTPDSQQ